MDNLNMNEYVNEASLMLKNKTPEEVKSFCLLYFIAVYNQKVALKQWRDFEEHQSVLKVKEEARKKINDKLFANWHIADRDAELVRWHKIYTTMHFEEDVLGNIYLIYSKAFTRKKMGEHYTREDIVRYIVREFSQGSLLEKKMLDPCCGSGNFLVELLRVSFDQCKNQEEKNLLLDKLFKGKFIVGIDIQEIPCLISSIRILLEVLLHQGKLHPNHEAPILQKNTLKDYEICENDKFDLVITNPPYLRYQLIDPEDRQIFIDQYFSAVGRFDLYVLFIEKCINLTRKFGEIIILTSDKFMNADYGRNIRKLISEKTQLVKVQDLRNIFVFEASVLSAVYYLKKIEGVTTQAIWEKVMEDKKIFYRINQGHIFMEETWKYIHADVMNVVEKINKLPKVTPIGALCNISIGIQTTADKIFCEKTNDRKFLDNKVEKQLIHRLVRGKTINKWRIGDKYAEFKTMDRVLYPYIEDEGKTRVIELEKFQHAKKYLYQYKDKLEKRKYLSEKKWYEHLSPKSFESLKALKIVTPDLSSGCKFALDMDGFFCNGTVYYIRYRTYHSYEDYLYLIALLNSKLIEFMHKNINTVHLASNKYRFQANTIKRYPIILINKEKDIYQKIVTLVKCIMDNNDVDFCSIEKKINYHVYQIYDLEDEEIEIIEKFLKVID